MKKRIAENLKHARRFRRYSVMQLARELEITKDEYEAYEMGEELPDMEMLEEMAEVLEVSVDDLMGKKNDIRPWEEAETQRECLYKEAPGFIHQRVCLRISMALEKYLSRHCGKYRVVPGPFTVILDEDDDVIEQPDISVICSKDMIQDGMYYGAPEVIIEVLSPYDEKEDILEKCELYKCYDVGECWLINPMNQRVILYDFETGKAPVIGSFDTPISSARLKGFRLCMAEIMRR